MRLVVLESPYAAGAEASVADHVEYARRAMRECLHCDEAPIASHILWAHSGALNDADPLERRVGMQAGHEWIRRADAVVVYTDYGMSKGMHAGIAIAEAAGVRIEYRTIGRNP